MFLVTWKMNAIRYDALTDSATAAETLHELLTQNPQIYAVRITETADDRDEWE